MKCNNCKAMSAKLEELQRVANVDPLTSVLNRRGLEEAIRREWSRADRCKSRIHAALLDLDDFKQVNDTYGHTTGDHILRRVAKSLLGAVRACDSVARIGGDEFVLLIPDSTPEQARGVAERARSSVASQNGAVTTVTCSLGIAPVLKPSVDRIIAACGHGLKNGKTNGKNRVEETPTSAADLG